MSSLFRKLTPKSQKGTITLTYFKFRGICLPIKMMLEWLEVPYDYQHYYMGEGPKFDLSDWVTDKQTLGIDFANLPFYTEGGMRLAESFAILRHIARSSRMFYPKTDEEERACDVAQGATQDFRTAVIDVAYNSNYREAKDNFVANLSTTLGNFERVLASRQWLTGNKMMYVDFVFADVLDWLELMEPGCLDVIPNVKLYYVRFEGQPQVVRYKRSDKYYKFPVMSRKAAWGGEPVL